MPSAEGVLSVVNVVAAVLFIGLCVAIALRLVWRVAQFWRWHRPVPLLLKRDSVLFGAITIVFGIAMAARLFGIDGLRTNLIYVVFVDALIIGALGLWCWIEYRVID